MITPESTTNSYRLCIDIGGTFTDCIVEDTSGDYHIFKVPTTPGEFQIGFTDSIRLAAAGFDLSLEAFLSQVGQIVHGSTVATNALVEMKVASTGFLTNAGHLDILTIREAVRKPVFSWQLDYPDPFVPRTRTFGIAGRIDAQGNEVTPLKEEAVRAAVEAMKAGGIEAIGIAFLWSIVNPTHELRAREIVRDMWPTVDVTLSHELNPVGREYRRAISTVIDASLHPIVSSYVRALVNALREAGYTKGLLLANCVGGMMPPDELMRRPIYSVMSGPTLAPVAAQRLAPGRSVIVTDMGGTTFDVSALRDGSLIISQEAMIGKDMLGISKIDVRSVGAGGGSIAWVDQGGMLRVGPHSAAARPGPACYGLGGTSPTVTDANLILGILDPENFLGGQMMLDCEASEHVMRPLADRLGLSTEETAYAIYTTSNNVMVGLIEDMTVKEGINPRDSSIVAGGGATAAHIAEMARELGITEVIIPRFAAGLSAFGGLISDVEWEEKATVITAGDSFALDIVNAELSQLRAAGDGFLDRADVPADRRQFEYYFLGRYRYQSWELEVPFSAPGGQLGSDQLPELVSAFHAMHERVYSVKMETDVVEFTTWKLRAIGKRPGVVPQVGGLSHDPYAPQEAAVRQVYFREYGCMISCPIFDGQSLLPGARIVGPAVVEEPTTTIYIPGDAAVHVDAAGNYLMSVGFSASSSHMQG